MTFCCSLRIRSVLSPGLAGTGLTTLPDELTLGTDALPLAALVVVSHEAFVPDIPEGKSGCVQDSPSSLARHARPRMMIFLKRRLVMLLDSHVHAQASTCSCGLSSRAKTGEDDTARAIAAIRTCFTAFTSVARVGNRVPQDAPPLLPNRRRCRMAPCAVRGWCGHKPGVSTASSGPCDTREGDSNSSYRFRAGHPCRCASQCPGHGS